MQWVGGEVNNSLARLLGRLPRWGLAGRVAVLTVLMAGAGLLAGGFAYWHGGPAEVSAAGLAAGVCLLAGYGALVISSLLSTPKWALFGLAGGMLFRMALPLAVCFALVARGGSLVEHGLPAYVVVFYLVGLLVETALVLPTAGASKS